MAFVYEIIKGAYREANLLPITQTPTPEEQAEALTLLNRQIQAVYGAEAGENFSEVFSGDLNVVTPDAAVTTDITSLPFAPLNTRVICNNSEAVTFNLHPEPADGSRFSLIDVAGTAATYPITLVGNGRKIQGAAQIILNEAGVNKEWFYRADLGEWKLVSSLALSDIFPFPLEFEDFFILGLALRINPRYGTVIDSQSLQKYQKGLTLFRARYAQTKEIRSELALLTTSSQRPSSFLKGY